MSQPLSDEEFDALEDRVDALAAQPPVAHRPDGESQHERDPAHNERDFEELVRSALDELPSEVLQQLGNTPVVVSDNGSGEHAYGEYHGINNRGHTGFYADFLGGPADQPRILIFRDTLVRDFGHDPQLLRDQVRVTVRHEVAHFLGFDEAGVDRLGL